MHGAGTLPPPPPRVLRQFAGLWLLAFGGLALWQGFARGNVALAGGLAVLAAVVGGLGIARPEVVRPIFVGWMVATSPIRWITSLALLAVIYYGLLVPMGLAMRAAGRDELRLKRRPGEESYWLPKVGPTHLRRYFQQF